MVRRNKWIFDTHDQGGELVLQRSTRMKHEAVSTSLSMPSIHISGGMEAGAEVRWNEDGVWRIGFYRKIGICSVLEVELWGLYEVELKVASKVFKVRVCEFNPCFTPNSAWCSEEEESNFSTSDDAVENNKLSNAKGLKASSSVASSKSNRSHPPVSKKDIKCPRVVEDINYACMGKLFEDSVDSFENTEERFIGEPEILGCKPNVEMPSVVDGGNISNENYNSWRPGLLDLNHGQNVWTN
ncbi:hypothetical protein V6N11_045187 [Hibiscus sabdariffa]|uniref:Uncharacterized protein n=1 Tax=Hibiscus sabdariffa TaxID=183260 RepID=A0ABR2NEP9_9ROSI